VEDGAGLVAGRRGRGCGKAEDVNREGVAQPDVPLHGGVGKEESSRGTD